MKKRIRVGIVGPCPPSYGGVTRIISNHLQYWQDLPIETWLIPLVVPKGPEVYPYTSLVNQDKTTKSWVARTSAAFRVGSRLSPMRLSTLSNVLSFDCVLNESIQGLNLDVIYAHHATINGMLAVKAARQGGIPSLVVAYAETWLAQSEDRRWKRAIDFTVANADWIVSTSEHCRRGAISRGADPSRSSVIYAGIDLERFRPGLDGQ